MKNRIAWLDLFRGLAAVMIVLYHYQRYLGFRNFEFGFVAVDGFFVLSGIVLAMKYTDAIAEGMPFRSFAAARLKRLYPMVFIAGLFIVSLNLADAPRNPFMGAGPNGVWTVFLLFVPKVGELTTFTSAAFPADVPMWSLWAELVANVLWFAVIRAGTRWMTLLGGTSVLLLVVLTWQHNDLNIGWDNSVSTRVFTLVRALAWFSIGYSIARTKVKPPVSPFVLTIGLAAFFIAFVSGVPVSWYSELVTVAIGAALLHALYNAAPPGRIVSTVSKSLGLVSYPLYLVHGPAGRLLPHFGDAMPHGIVLLLLVGPAAAIATGLNECIIGLLRGRRPTSVWALSRPAI